MLYAGAGDFREAFLSNMNHLYLLAYLMTGDQEMAERCFVDGIDHCLSGNPVFKERAQSWARRAIVKIAIRMTLPESTNRNQRSKTIHDPLIDRLIIHGLLRCVVQLDPFDRCVFVMSVFERFSDYECSLLLSSTLGAVDRGRRRAIEQLASVLV